MARIRTIKPEFFRHHDLWSAERDSGLPLRVAFAGLWCVADRAGRFKWRPAEIKIQVLPYDDVDFAAVLDALARRGFVQRYTVEDVEYGVVPSLAQHQVFNSREKDSSLPAPTQRQACDEPASGQRGKEGNEEGNGFPSETAAADAATVVFNQGRQWLQRATGKSEDRCRSLLGKWRRDHGDAALIAVLGRAQREGPIDAVQWIEAALRRPARASPGAAAHQGFNL